LPENDLALLIDAAEAAGTIAEGFWQTNPQTWEKPGGAGPVTEADLAVDRMLHAELTASRPDYGWLSEESVDTTARLDREYTFIVDPIDGTRAFVAGGEHWSHSLAIARGGQVTAAVVFLPVTGMLYAATLGGGATVNGTPMRVSARDRLDGASVLSAKPSLDPKHWPGGIPPIRRHFRPSLAYRLALVAEGRFDAMLTLHDTWEWDVAAGTLLALESGAVVSDKQGATPVFNNRHPALNGILAGGAHVHAEISARLMNGPARA